MGEEEEASAEAVMGAFCSSFLCLFLVFLLFFQRHTYDGRRAIRMFFFFDPA